MLHARKDSQEGLGLFLRASGPCFTRLFMRCRRGAQGSMRFPINLADTPLGIMVSCDKIHCSRHTAGFACD